MNRIVVSLEGGPLDGIEVHRLASAGDVIVLPEAIDVGDPRDEPAVLPPFPRQVRYKIEQRGEKLIGVYVTADSE